MRIYDQGIGRSMMTKKICAAAFLLMSTYVYAADLPPIDGFRSARFGANEGIVRAAINKDFGVAADKIKEQADPRTATKSLEVALTKLEPINVPATISYILGYKCRCLIQVNVVWNLPENNTVAQRDEALVGASALAKHFAGKSWSGGEVLSDRISGEPKEGLVTNYFFFRGVAPSGHAVTVWGAPVTLVKAKGSPPSADGKNESGLTADIDKLRTIAVTYELNVKSPDLRRVSVDGF